MTEIHTGVCTICRQLRVLLADGTLILHDRPITRLGRRSHWGRCEGSNLPPRTIEALKAEVSP